jgi:hypothetical protein
VTNLTQIQPLLFFISSCVRRSSLINLWAIRLRVDTFLFTLCVARGRAIFYWLRITNVFPCNYDDQSVQLSGVHSGTCVRDLSYPLRKEGS